MLHITLYKIFGIIYYILHIIYYITQKFRYNIIIIYYILYYYIIQKFSVYYTLYITYYIIQNLLTHNATASVKFTAGQARYIYQYKNLRIKVRICCTDIFFNRYYTKFVNTERDGLCQKKKRKKIFGFYSLLDGEVIANKCHTSQNGVKSHWETS